MGSSMQVPVSAPELTAGRIQAPSLNIWNADSPTFRSASVIFFFFCQDI